MAATFEEFTRFVNQFGSVPIQLLEFNHVPRTFGNWFMIVQKGGHELRIVFEGKENLFALQKKTGSSNWSDIWTGSNIGDWMVELIKQLNAA